MDQVTVRGLLTKQANEEAMKLIYSPKNLIDITGQCSRVITNEAINSLYALTRD